LRRRSKLMRSKEPAIAAVIRALSADAVPRGARREGLSMAGISQVTKDKAEAMRAVCA
jgi:hypothetical protein